jgi:membrane fusion protein (multidrug efflux system)
MDDQSGASGGRPAGSKGAEPGTGEVPKRKSRRGGLLALLVLLVVGALGVGYWYVKLRGVVSTDDAYVDGDRATVTTKMLGRIDSLCADEGDTVQAGQLLIRLDDADLQAQLAQASAQLDLARKSVTLAEVTEARAKDDFDRASMQFQGNAIPREQLDHARAALESAQAEHAIALARVETARTALDVVRQHIEDTRVTAPFTGVVAKRWLLPGDVVQPGQPVLTIYDIDSTWVTAVFEETKLRFLPVGTRVDMTVDAYPDRTFEGTVILIGAAAASQFSLIPPANASGNFTKVTQRVPIRIAIDRASGAGADPVRLLPGMSVVVTVAR